MLAVSCFILSECTELGDRIKRFSYKGKRENCSHLEAADCSAKDWMLNLIGCASLEKIVHSLKHQKSEFQDICFFFELQHV